MALQPVIEEQESKVSTVNGVLTFRDEIGMSTSLELTAMKLNAFISSADVRLTHQEHGHLKMQTGSLGFTRRWGTTIERQPIDIDVRFETTRVQDPRTGEGRTRRTVVVTITPIGKVPNEATFELRCLQLMINLRSYLLAS